MVLKSILDAKEAPTFHLDKNHSQ